MNLKASLKYQMQTALKATGIYFGILYLIIITFMIINMYFDPKEGNLIAGLEASSAIFMMMLGIFTFEEDFKFLIQNACSRKTMLCSFIIQFLCISLLVASADTLNSIIINQAFKYESIFMQVYGDLGYHLNFLWSFLLYFMICMVSYFFTTLFRLLNKYMRYILFLGIPMILLMLLPAVDYAFLNGAISAFILDSMLFVFGLQNGINVIIPVLSFASISMVFMSFVYLTTRKAVCL